MLKQQPQINGSVSCWYLVQILLYNVLPFTVDFAEIVFAHNSVKWQLLLTDQIENDQNEDDLRCMFVLTLRDPIL